MQQSLKIVVPPVSQRTWKHLDETPFTAEELLAIVHRYCDMEDHRKAYRVRRAATLKAAMVMFKAQAKADVVGEQEQEDDES